MREVHRVCIVGAGFISDIHLEALKTVSSAVVTAVVDSHLEKAKACASRWGIAAAYGCIDDVLNSGGSNVAHVLVPPDRHLSVAQPLLQAGLSVFLEKPMATSLADCEVLNHAAQASGARLGINQNFLFHPAYLVLKQRVEAKELGHLHHIISYLNIPLRQLTARQFSHWMFRLPQNIVLEQAVHPLSQIYDLAGKMLSADSHLGKPRQLTPTTRFYDTWLVSMTCERATAQLFLSFGQSFPAFGLIAICEDGAMFADLLHNQSFVQTKTKWTEGFDAFLNGRAMVRMVRSQNYRNFFNYLLGTLKVRLRSDPFFLSMKNSIAAFYRGLDTGSPVVDGGFGAKVVEMCECIAKGLAMDSAEHRTAGEATQRWTGQYDVAVLGGTGFIGAHLVRRLLGAGLRVGVLARNAQNLPALFRQSVVEVIPGDTARAEDVERAIGHAKVVVDLAHGGGGATWQEVSRAMVGGARTVAECCLKKGVERLIYVSSIAALYLGGSGEVITGATGYDPEFERRGIYARAKAVSEQVLLQMYRERSLPVCVLRPGIVVGEGGEPFHSALGQFNHDLHCIGWNRGENPLPFVLVEDVAEAIRLAICANGLVGRCYNLVGDVRLSAHQYIVELGRALGRPLRFHPQSVLKLQVVEIGRWLIKRLIGRADSPFPSWRDLMSRGMLARFDCTDAKRDLKWAPVVSRNEFMRRGIEVHRKGNRM